MYLVDKFVVKQSKTDVFGTLLTLLKEFPRMTLTYRNGRGTTDEFTEQAVAINEVSFRLIKYSSQWRIYLSRNKKLSINFHFVDNQLQWFTDDESKIKIPANYPSFNSKINLFTRQLVSAMSKFLTSEKS